MRLLLACILSTFFFVAPRMALGQTRDVVRKTARVHTSVNGGGEAAPPAAEAKEEAATEGAEGEQLIRIYLVGGRRLDADEVTESAEGYWYRRGNVTTLLDKARVERVERGPEPEPAAATPEKSQTTGSWSLADAAKVESFFAARFGRPLPVTTFGQSGLHTRWGLDHRRSMDVGLHPDSREGSALIEFLRREGIPYLAFRRAIPGAATAPHIHIGRPSPGLYLR